MTFSFILISKSSACYNGFFLLVFALQQLLIGFSRFARNVQKHTHIDDAKTHRTRNYGGRWDSCLFRSCFEIWSAVHPSNSSVLLCCVIMLPTTSIVLFFDGISNDCQIYWILACSDALTRTARYVNKWILSNLIQIIHHHQHFVVSLLLGAFIHSFPPRSLSFAPFLFLCVTKRFALQRWKPNSKH